MDLIPYDEKYVPEGNGFINLGATCYFNSLLQCLLSCPSIYQTLNSSRNKEHIKKNRLACNLLSLWDDALQDKSVYDKCIPIWRDIITISNHKNNRIKMDNGQQDAHEGLMMFLEAMDTIPEVKRLFEHRYRITAYCDVCKKNVIDKKEEHLVFEIQPILKNEQIEKFKDRDEFFNQVMDLNKFLHTQNSYLDNFHLCEVCKTKSEKFKQTVLTMLPEILVITFKKYERKVLTPFPEYLKFKMLGSNKILIYHLVAQSEHSGSMNGGHYWAVCRRKNKWATLNDSSVSLGNPGPTPNTYIIFYNFLRMEDSA